MSGFSPDIALDALFRRNVATRPDACALRDLDGVAMSYAELSNAVASVVEQIASFNLPKASTVALLLPNGRELAIALLAVMRSGHVAAPMPVAWRKSDLVRACREAEAAALITTANFAAEDLPALAAEVAIEVFELSFPCAFGSNLPDGLVPLVIDTTQARPLANTAIAQTDAPGIGTMRAVTGGTSFVLHGDEELLAAGLGAMLAGGMQSGDRIVSATSLTPFAGLASAFVPWVLCSGTLSLLPELPRKGVADFDKQTHLIATAGLLSELCAASGSAVASVFAVHFSGTEALTAFPALNASKVVDVIALNEVCAVALPRRERGIAAALPLGAIHAGDTGAASPVILETRIENTRLEIRGAIVPRDVMGDQEWLDTGFSATAGTGGLYVMPPEELLCIGALSFNCPDLERRIRSAALVSEAYAVEDPLLGAKLVITSDQPEVTTKALLDAGLPRIVALSARKTEAVRATAS